jgi:DNA-binding response OmpR family regulator
MHVLLLEDDLDLGQATVNALRQEGLTVRWHRSPEGLHGIDRDGIDAVLLDLGLPQADGMDLLRAWRRAGWAVPVMVISARSALPERLAGLDEGADDYLPKPFAMPSSCPPARRYTAATNARPASAGASGRWRSCRKPRLGGRCAGGLSAREFQLLEGVGAQQAVVSKSALGRRLEPLGEPLEGSVIEVHMSNLRRKIGTHRIRTLRGVGYQLTE